LASFSVIGGRSVAALDVTEALAVSGDLAQLLVTEEHRKSRSQPFVISRSQVHLPAWLQPLAVIFGRANRPQSVVVEATLHAAGSSAVCGVGAALVGLANVQVTATGTLTAGDTRRV
jgi:hypothetical protein